jgi:hypothetical protein
MARFPARWTPGEENRPFSRGSTLVVISQQRFEAFANAPPCGSIGCVALVLASLLSLGDDLCANKRLMFEVAHKASNRPKSEVSPLPMGFN